MLAQWFLLFCVTGHAPGASKAHVIAFGRWASITLLTGPNDGQAVALKIRPLFVDAALKAYAFGLPHEITDRLFVVQRMMRLNDALPSEVTAPRWVWQRGGWLLVDRMTGHITPVNLPEFDPDYSVANWYRDYVAYCGISQDARNVYAMVMQLGQRKPILKKSIAEANDNAAAAECAPPAWQRQPARVTFAWKPDQKITYAVRGSAVQINDDDEEATE